MTQAVLLGGLFIGVLSALPFVNAANCCCLWIIGGGAIAAFLAQQDDPQSLGPYVKAPEKKGDVAHVVYLPWQKYDRNDATTTSLEYPSDATILSPLVGWEQQPRVTVSPPPTFAGTPRHDQDARGPSLQGVRSDRC